MVIGANEGTGNPIRNVLPDSPAAKAGLKQGETLLKLDGKALTEPESLNEAINAKKVGDVVTVTVERDKKPVEVKVTLGTLPAQSG